MPTTTLSLKYRPMRIGFLVREGNLDDLVSAANINTLLWGGLYNPIIPVSLDNNIDTVNQLINIFSVDILVPLSNTKEIEDIIERYPFLSSPNHYSKNIYYEDWHSKQNVIAFLDSINIIDRLWEKNFKFRDELYKSNYILVDWDNDDSCNNLFSILFGKIPNSLNLKYDYRNTFKKGLKSKEFHVKNNFLLDSILINNISPIELTTTLLSQYNNSSGKSGIYIGLSNDFYDLLNYWNLRASGVEILYLPIDFIDRFKEITNKYIENQKNIPNRNPNFDNDFCIYSRNNIETIKCITEEYQKNKRLVYSLLNKDVLTNIRHNSIYFTSQQIPANVDKTYDKYTVSFSLPEKTFINKDSFRNIQNQQLVVSVSALGEFGYANHTIQPPFIRELNEFYSRELVFDPWMIRSEESGIGIIINESENALSLYPISHQKLIEKIFDLAGFKVNMSQAGLLAKQIVVGMRDYDPLEACRVFKITGVRALIKETGVNKYITWDYAINIIGKNRFSKFKSFL